MKKAILRIAMTGLLPALGACGGGSDETPVTGGEAIFTSAAVSGAVEETAMSTEELADKFLHALFNDDTVDAYAVYAVPDFIQHNPHLKNGEAGPPPAATEAREVIDMVLVEGDLFGALHHSFDGPGDKGRMVFDIWRVEKGRIVEHWDVTQERPETFLHDNTAWCGIGNSYEEADGLGNTLVEPTCGWPDPDTESEATLDIIDQYVTAVGQGDVEAAINEWFSGDYRQHSHYIADGAQGAIDYLNTEWGKDTEETPYLEHARRIAQGDLVAYHLYVRQPGDPLGNVQVDVFRVTDGKISEHWDFKQPVTEETASGNRMW